MSDKQPNRQMQHLQIQLENARRNTAAQPDDPELQRRLADTIATLAFESGFYPETGDAYYVLYDEAIGIYKSLLTTTPDDGTLLNDYGAALCDRGRFGEALTPLRKAADLLPDYRAPLYNLAVALMNAGTPDGHEHASECFRRAHKLRRCNTMREAYFDPHGY